MKKSVNQKPLIMPTPVWLVGTYDSDGRPNVMTISWGGICCSQPPCLAISLRKATYSHASIVARKAFTVGVPSEDQIAIADYFGLASGRDEDKIARAGMTAVRSDVVDAPYLAEISLVVECKLIHTFELGLHTQFVGEIIDIKADESVINEKGFPDIEKVRPVIATPGARAYHGIGRYLGPSFSIGRTMGQPTPKKERSASE